MISLDFYNKDIKDRYLETIEEVSRETIGYILYKATPLEKLLKRDLYTFSLEEIGSVMSHSNPLNNRVAERTALILNKYIQWALETGYYTTNMHPMRGIKKNWAHDFVAEKDLFVSEERLIKIEDDLENYQDKVAIRLPFEGIMGSDLSEVLNLKAEDVFDGGILKLEDSKKGNREAQVSDRAISFIKGALAESSYKKWSTSEDKKMLTDYEVLVDNDYVLRGLRRKKGEDKNQPQGYQVVYRRIKTIMEKENLNYITAKQLQRSGMLAMAARLIKERGKYTVQERDEICEKYNVSHIQNGNYYYYNYVSINFINEKNLKKYYNIDLNTVSSK